MKKNTIIIIIIVVAVVLLLFAAVVAGIFYYIFSAAKEGDKVQSDLQNSIMEAEHLIENKEYEQAIAKTSEAISLDDQFVPAYVVRCKAYRKNDELDAL